MHCSLSLLTVFVLKSILSEMLLSQVSFSFFCMDYDFPSSQSVCILGLHYISLGFPDSSFGKESACNAGDPGSIPESGRSPGEGKGYPYMIGLVLLSVQPLSVSD